MLRTLLGWIRWGVKPAPNLAVTPWNHRDDEFSPSLGPVTTVGDEPTSLDDTVPFVYRPRIANLPPTSPGAADCAGGFLSPLDVE